MLIALGVLIRVAPTPAGLNPTAWHYFALFVAIIAAFTGRVEPVTARDLHPLCGPYLST